MAPPAQFSWLETAKELDWCEPNTVIHISSSLQLNNVEVFNAVTNLLFFVHWIPLCYNITYTVPLKWQYRMLPYTAVFVALSGVFVHVTMTYLSVYIDTLVLFCSVWWSLFVILEVQFNLSLRWNLILLVLGYFSQIVLLILVNNHMIALIATWTLVIGSCLTTMVLVKTCRSDNNVEQVLSISVAEDQDFTPLAENDNPRMNLNSKDEEVSAMFRRTGKLLALGVVFVVFDALPCIRDPPMWYSLGHGFWHLVVQWTLHQWVLVWCYIASRRAAQNDAFSIGIRYCSVGSFRFPVFLRKE